MQRLILLCVLNFICFTGFSQTKIGYVNLLALIDSLPQTTMARVTLNRLNDSLVTALDKESKNMYSKVDRPPAGFNQDSLTAMQDSLQAHQYKAQVVYDSAQNKLLSPIVQMVKDATKMVAKEQGYDYVLDSGSKDCLFSVNRGEDDLTPLVRKKLGLK